MSFALALDEKQLACKKWPNQSAYIAADGKKESMSKCRIIPTTYEAICCWATVLHISQALDRTRDNVLVYRYKEDGTPCGPHDLFQLGGRFQGILHDHNFSSLGNWDGTEKNAMKVTQFLIIHAPGNTDTFYPQEMALNNIHRLAAREAMVGDENRVETPGRITFERRVFTKVRGRQSMWPSALVPEDDPFQVTAKILGNWRVVKKIDFGKRLANGVVVATQSSVLSRGNLIDIHFNIDIVCLRKVGEPTRLGLKLAFTHVIQLVPAFTVASVLPAAGPAAASAHPVIEHTEWEFVLQEEAQLSDMEDEEM